MEIQAKEQTIEAAIKEKERAIALEKKEKETLLQSQLLDIQFKEQDKKENQKLIGQQCKFAIERKEHELKTQKMKDDAELEKEANLLKMKAKYYTPEVMKLMALEKSD